MNTTKPAFHVNSSFFLAANVARSFEETRYYLNGVYVEPHEDGGVLLVATDGHRLIAVHDASGYTEKPVIIRVEKADLKKLKQGTAHRIKQLVITDVSKSGTVPASVGLINRETGEQSTHDILQAHIIDGTFPDWRRVLPTTTPDKAAPGFIAYNSSYLDAFGTARALLKEGLDQRTRGKSTGEAISIRVPDTAGDPTLIGLDVAGGIAFGVLMPLRASAPEVPYWAGVGPAYDAHAELKAKQRMKAEETQQAMQEAA